MLFTVCECVINNYFGQFYILLSWKSWYCGSNSNKCPRYAFPCSGIGLALCERLLTQDTEGLQLCLACRNMRRAQTARSALLTSHPTAQVALLQMDTSSMSSVITAAQEVKRRWEDGLVAAWKSNTHSHTQISTEPGCVSGSLCMLESYSMKDLCLCLSPAGIRGWITSTWMQASCQTHSLM